MMMPHDTSDIFSIPVTNQSVQAVNGCDEIIFFVTSLNSIFCVPGVKGVKLNY
jgi:hypothetical protein